LNDDLSGWPVVSWTEVEERLKRRRPERDEVVCSAACAETVEAKRSGNSQK
jgi:hypothetical protein